MWRAYTNQHTSEVVNVKTAVENLEAIFTNLGFDSCMKQNDFTIEPEDVELLSEQEDRYYKAAEECQLFLKDERCVKCLCAALHRLRLEKYVKLIEEFL